MNMNISFNPADVLIVPNISERRAGTELFKKNLNKIFHFIGEKDFFIFCRDTNDTKHVHGKCNINWYDLNTYQVLEHAKRRHELDLEQRKRELHQKHQNHSVPLMLPDAVIIIMVHPNALNNILEEKTNDIIINSQWHNKRQRHDNKANKDLRKINTIDSLNKKYQSDTIRYENKRIQEQCINYGIEMSDNDLDKLTHDIHDIQHNIYYIENISENNTDYLNDYIEENAGLKISRVFRPHRLFTRNRQALKRFNPTDKRQKWRHPDFKHHYGGRTHRLNRGKKSTKCKKSFRRHAPLF